MNEKNTVKRPWLKLYDGFPADFEVPDLTIYEKLSSVAKSHPNLTALAYLGKTFTFTALMQEIDRCAAAFEANGISKGDNVMLSMPNIPNTIIMLYALNKIGVRVAMTHPLSSAAELKHYLSESGSRWAVTVDMFYNRFEQILEETDIERLMITHISDYLTAPKKVGFFATKRRKIQPVPKDDPRLLDWKPFMKSAGSDSDFADKEYVRQINSDEGSVVLFSGGTTSMPKGIELSSKNFNALAISMGFITGLSPGESVLAILPVFHGFGLGLCIHTTMCAGASPILVPEFSTKVYIDNLIKNKPTYIAGVPTLFQALMKDPKFKKVRFDKLKNAYSGGDSLPPEMKVRFDEVIKELGGSVELLEGYGLTECVTACIVSPAHNYRQNSIGVPIPGMLAKVIDPDTMEELPYDEEGEICVAGPTIMNGYIGDPVATEQALKKHADGHLWLHSGDIGSMDSDGYLYFKNRIKRIIKVSGVSVYPMQVEQVLEKHDAVWRACVIGTPDDYQISSVKAFVVLNEGFVDDEKTRKDLIAHCKKHLIKWAVPRSIDFRPDLPTTLVGKIAYTELEREELAKLEKNT